MLFVRWRQIVKRRRQRLNQNFLELTEIINLFGHLFINLINVLILITRWLRLRRHKMRRLFKPHMVLQLLGGYRRQYRTRNLWVKLEQNWTYFYWLTGEIPPSLQLLVDSAQCEFFPIVNQGRNQVMDFCNQILLTMIWLKKYPTFIHLSTHFSISVSCTHRIVHKCIKLLHAYLVPRYIRWHTMQQWCNLSGTYPEWPRVVAILDCTPFRISHPRGPMQCMFYRRDRHCFFLNWVVIVDVLGYVVLSHPGFIGCVHDTVHFQNVNLPVLPAGLQIMADQGFEHRTFKSRRSMIE